MKKVILGLLLIPIALVIVGVVGTELNKAYWDSRVREMCEAEGGVTVLERIELNSLEASRMGANEIEMIRLPAERTAPLDYPYVTRNTINPIKEGYLKVFKFETQIVRRMDDKIIATMVDFGRRGGDFPTGIAAPSNFSCRDVEGADFNLKTSVFIKVQ